MKHKRSVLFAVILGGLAPVFAGVCFAAGAGEGNSTRSLPVRITRSPSGAVSYGEAVRYQNSMLELKIGQGTISIPASSIGAAEFALLPEVIQAGEAYRAGRLEEAVAGYRSLEGFGSLARLPGSNIGTELLNRADALRQLRRFDEAGKTLDEIEYGDNEDAKARALLIRAFILCDKDRLDEAEKLLEDFNPTDRGDLNFPLDRIVRTRIALGRGQLHEAALNIGESLASTRIESPIYPELLYLAGICYESMGKAAEERAKGRATDQADALMGQEVDYTALVEAVRQELCFIYPQSYWAKKNPVNVEKLLAQAKGIKIGTAGGEEETAVEPPEAGAAPGGDSPPAKPASPWNKFLDRLKPESPTNAPTNKK